MSPRRFLITVVYPNRSPVTYSRAGGSSCGHLLAAMERAGDVPVRISVRRCHPAMERPA